jgi:hypothetical protein
MTNSAVTKDAIPRPAPAEFAGQRVAWNNERTMIVAHGPKMVAVNKAALAAGHPDAILQRVRHPNVCFIGTT